MNKKDIVNGFINGTIKITITYIDSVEKMKEIISIFNCFGYKWSTGQKLTFDNSGYERANATNGISYTIQWNTKFCFGYSTDGNYYPSSHLGIECSHFLEIMKDAKQYIRNY